MELTRGGKTEAVPKFKNIVTMKEEDFSDLLDDIQKEIQNLVYSLMK